jgi:hypothetical protein
LEKYNFKTSGKEIKCPQKLYFLKLDQEEFEKRGFLEMLHYASKNLHQKKNLNNGQNSNAADVNVIDQHKNEFTHLFLENGKEI